MGTFKYKSIVNIIFKKTNNTHTHTRSILLKVKPLSLPPVHHPKHRWVNVWLSFRWTNWTAPSCWVGIVLDSHVVLFPSHHKRVPSGGMLNQHVDFCLTCVWHSWLHWEYCLISVPTLQPPTPPRKRVCRLYWTGYPFGYHIRRCYSPSYGDHESDRHRYNLRLNPNGPVFCFFFPTPMCQWTYCLLEVMCFGTPIGQLVGETAKGPKYPTEAGVSSKVKNKFFFLFFLLSLILFWVGD